MCAAEFIIALGTTLASTVSHPVPGSFCLVEVWSLLMLPLLAGPVACTRLADVTDLLERAGPECPEPVDHWLAVMCSVCLLV